MLHGLVGLPRDASMSLRVRVVEVLQEDASTGAHLVRTWSWLVRIIIRALRTTIRKVLNELIDCHVSGDVHDDTLPRRDLEEGNSERVLVQDVAQFMEQHGLALLRVELLAEEIWVDEHLPVLGIRVE